MAAEKLRDLTQPIDVPLLDATVSAFYGTGSKEERNAADQILRELQNNPDTWLQVVHILSSTQNLNTKFFALQVLEGVIKYRWNALPVDQRDGMKNYISDVIVKLSSDENSFRRERLYVNKLNIILVQILKHEWPSRWRSFIPDLVAAAKTSETICENCMAILKLLSEEVFDFSRGEMTQQKIKELKQSLNSEFQLIHELCLYVLSASQRTELIRATLATLHAFLSWIPLGYIFESPLLETLLKFFPLPSYRNLTLQCLTEVAALNFGDFYNLQYVKMYGIFMLTLQAIIPTSANIPEAYAQGSSEEQAFIQNLALFFTSFYKFHIRILETTQENIAALLMGLEYLIDISYVDDTEVFKVCLDYWNSLVLELFETHHNMDNPAATANMMGLQMPLLHGLADGVGSQIMQRRQLYANPMSRLRLLMICRMAKPEEVLIVEDENGNIVRETMKDNDVLVQYKIMRETLIYLSHLDHEDTEKQGCIPDMLPMWYSPGERTNYSTDIFKGELKIPVPSNSTAPKSIPVMYFKMEKSLYEMSGYHWADFSIRHPNKYMLSVNGVGKTVDEAYIIACETFEEPLVNWLKVPANFGSKNLLPITLKSFFKDVINGAMFVDMQSNGLLEAELSIHDVYIINGQAKFGLLKKRLASDVTSGFRNMVRKVYENNHIPDLLDHLLVCMKTVKRWSMTFVTHPVFLTHPQMCTYVKLSYETIRARHKLANYVVTDLNHLYNYTYGALDWRQKVEHKALSKILYFQKKIPPNSGEEKKIEELPKEAEEREVGVGEEVEKKKTDYTHEAWSLLEFYRNLVVHKKGTLTDEQVVLEMNKIAPNFLELVHEALSEYQILITVGDDLTLEEEKLITRAVL